MSSTRATPCTLRRPASSATFSSSGSTATRRSALARGRTSPRSRRWSRYARPVVPQMERLRMVTHQRGVGLVTLKHTRHPKWALIKAVRPDVLVATEETYSQDEIRELEAKYCGRVEVLERMATVSTSARLREIIMANPAPPVSQVNAGSARRTL